MCWNVVSSSRGVKIHIAEEIEIGHRRIWLRVERMPWSQYEQLGVRQFCMPLVARQGTVGKILCRQTCIVVYIVDQEFLSFHLEGSMNPTTWTRRCPAHRGFKFFYLYDKNCITYIYNVNHGPRWSWKKNVGVQKSYGTLTLRERKTRIIFIK